MYKTAKAALKQLLSALEAAECDEVERRTGMKDTEQIVKMLRQHRMGCFGCGYEHNCRDNGCALMQMAANELEKLTHHTEPENKPLTLERLRQMDGEPVWIKGSDAKTSGWALIKGKREKQIANCPDDWNISYYMKDYGKTWLAYSRKLENKPLTNGDLIRSMSNEELAVTLTCPNEMGMDEIDCDHSDDKNCCQCLLDWLNQPYEPEQEATL